MSVGGLLGAVLAPTLGRRVGTARGTLIAELAAAPFALLIPLTAPGPRLLLVVAGGVGVGVTVVAANVLKTSFRQAYVPRQILGRVIVGGRTFLHSSVRWVYPNPPRPSSHSPPVPEFTAGGSNGDPTMGAAVDLRRFRWRRRAVSVVVRRILAVSATGGRR